MDEDKKAKIIEIMKDNNVVAGFLFGSYARGTEGTMSDVDVAVLFPIEMDYKSQEARISDIRCGLERKFGMNKADVINIAKPESPLLRYNILIDEGKLLFSEDQKLVSYFTMKALRDFEDTRKLRKMRDIVLDKAFAPKDLKTFV